MLEELDIRNIGTISKASVVFGTGMTAITGETGAGKSMLLTAITMIMGEKPSRGKDAIARAYAQGIFSGMDDPYRDDDGMTYTGRSFSGNGRSKCTINGMPAPINSLKAITAGQITIHGQSEQMRLASDVMQTQMLDTYANNADILSSYQDAHAMVMATQKKMAMGTNHDLVGKREYLRDAIQRIEQADIRIGELDELKETLRTEEQRQQSMENRSTALHDLDSALDLLRSAGSSYPNEALDDAMETVQALASSLESSLSDDETVDIDSINERMYAIETIMKRYGGNEEEVLSFLDDSRHELHDIEEVMEDSESLRATLKTQIDDEKERAATLTASRTAAAKAMQDSINEELAHLSMPGASICIHITPSEPRGNGYDRVDFMFLPFKDSEAMPLGKSASGGELSRLMLAIELVVAEHADYHMGTFVFDEVDAGVGGKAAAELGKRLARLARQSQVIIVTHLAQVAAYADRQYIVDRNGGDTTILPATGDARTLEISRMLSGDHDNISTRHAESLLRKCDDYRKTLSES